MEKSRTTNTFFNFISSIGGQFITIIIQFITRTVFINTLGNAYLGINGLFSNILSMLSLAELGVGNAILFKLYKPIAKNDNHRIAILMKLYKKLYLIIGIVILLIGICLIPFLHILIKDYNKLSELGINAVFIYGLFLLQSVSSYLFFAYKSAIIKANQKEYLLNLISYASMIIFGIIQIISLLIFRNFELYAIIAVIQVIIQNFMGAILANKMYPFINKKTKDKIEKKEIKDVLKDCGSIFLYKLNGVVLTATDNIVISSFLGLSMVGMYSNYYILYNTIKLIFSKVFDSVAHSLGNLHACDEKNNQEYKIFKVINLISAILGATAGIGIFCISDEFVETWIGKEWLISQPFAFLMGVEIYTQSLRFFLGKYRSTMGLFQQAKYRPVAGMIINLVVSILLVKNWGICGVLVGTIVADWTTLMWFDPLIIYKYGFKGKFPLKSYFFKNLLYIIITIIIGAVCLFICNNILVGVNWLSVFFHVITCSLLVPLSFILPSLKTEEGKYLLYKIKESLLKIKNKMKKVTI